MLHRIPVPFPCFLALGDNAVTTARCDHGSLIAGKKLDIGSVSMSNKLSLGIAALNQCPHMEVVGSPSLECTVAVEMWH